MKKRNGKQARLSEDQIDQRVIAESENEAAWEKPIRIRRSKSAPLEIPGELAARVAFLARLHREKSADAWLERIIEERVAFEETVFGQVKREMGTSRRGGLARAGGARRAPCSAGVPPAFGGR